MPSSVLRVLIGTGNGLVAVDDRAARSIALEGLHIGALARDGAGWWALVDHTEIWHTPGGGGQWQRRAAVPGSRLTCLVATAQRVLIGTAGARLAMLSDGDDWQPVEGFDVVDGRDQWYTPWGGPPDTRSLSAGEGATVFANVHVGGIVASGDAGHSWQATSLDIHADVHQVLAGAAPDLVLAACAQGLAVSDDAGGTWRIDDEGLHATYSRAVAVSGDSVIISTSTGPDGGQSALYRRPLTSTGEFQRCREGLPEWFDGNIDTGCLVSAGATVACATRSGEVFISDDEGSTWGRAATEVASVSCLGLAER